MPTARFIFRYMLSVSCASVCILAYAPTQFRWYMYSSKGFHLFVVLAYEDSLDKLAPSAHTWWTVELAKPVLCFRSNFAHPFSYCLYLILILEYSAVVEVGIYVSCQLEKKWSVSETKNNQYKWVRNVNANWQGTTEIFMFLWYIFRCVFSTLHFFHRTQKFG